MTVKCPETGSCKQPKKWSRIKNKLIHVLCTLQNVHETQYFLFVNSTKYEKGHQVKNDILITRKYHNFTTDNDDTLTYFAYYFPVYIFLAL